jgi:hypothetical protein
VRCARCKKTWFAGNPQAITAIARSHREDLTALAAPAQAVAEPTAPSAVAPASPSAGTDDFSVLDAAPPTVPADPPPEAAAAQPPPEEVVRDDRGPAPPPDPDVQSPVPAAEVLPVASEPPLSDPTIEAPPKDIESVARRTRRQPGRKRSAGLRRWTTAILALVAINAGLVAWRAEIVRLLPQTASLYAAIRLPVNLRELVFHEIVTRVEQQDGVQMLLVEGIIKSNSRRNADVPRLRFAVRNVRGQEIYSWTALPAHNMLPPGGTMPFRTRLASPPPEAQAVLVRFFNRRDLVAGVQ